LVGKIVEAEKIDSQGCAIVEHPLHGYFTDIYPNEYEIVEGDN
jgi:hypothetical protein